jgi:hypothetical protein
MNRDVKTVLIIISSSVLAGLVLAKIQSKNV